MAWHACKCNAEGNPRFHAGNAGGRGWIIFSHDVGGNVWQRRATASRRSGSLKPQTGRQPIAHLSPSAGRGNLFGGRATRYSMICLWNTRRGAQRIGRVGVRGERQSFEASNPILASRTWATLAAWQLPCNACFTAALRALNSCPYQFHRQRTATPVLLSWRSICAVDGALRTCNGLRASMSIRRTRFLARRWSRVQTRGRP